MVVGIHEGCSVGAAEGTDGKNEGLAVGPNEGVVVGIHEGCSVGAAEGTTDGKNEGLAVVGFTDGAF